MNPADLLTYWEMAAKHPVGIAIQLNPKNRRLLMQRLYMARSAAGGYEDIIIVTPNIPEELWLVQRYADEGTGTAEADHD